MENNLPKGWIEVELKELISYRKGKKPKTLSTKEFKNSVPYLNIKAVEKNIIDEYADMESSNISNGDEIFVVWDGARSGWVAKGMKGAIGSTLMAMKPYLLNTNYLFRFLQTQFDNINSNPRGTGIPHVDPELFWNIQVPLAPLPEQQRIVTKLDSLMARIANSKTRLEKIPTLLKNFRQSVLAAAVSGELTKEWREENEVESVEKYLTKINKEFKDYTIDENKWVLTQVKNLYKSFGGGTPSRSEKSYWNGNIAWVSSGDVKENFIEKGSETITKKGLENSTAKLCPVDSIIVVVRSGILQHTFPVSIVKKELSINQDLKCFDSSDKNLNYWLFLVFKARQREILSFNREGTTVQSVKMDTLNNLEIQIPSVEEQKEIVQKVEEVFHFADSVEARYQKAKAWVDKMPQAILAKAFRGELVPQDENDEPASELLKRIQHAKQKNQPAGKAGHKPSFKAKKRKLYEDNDEMSLVAEE